MYLLIGTRNKFPGLYVKDVNVLYEMIWMCIKGISSYLFTDFMHCYILNSIYMV